MVRPSNYYEMSDEDRRAWDQQQRAIRNAEDARDSAMYERDRAIERAREEARHVRGRLVSWQDDYGALVGRYTVLRARLVGLIGEDEVGRLEKLAAPQEESEYVEE